MAFSTTSLAGTGKRGRFRGVSSLSEINVVPLVDVVLVLLIIFMLTAHVMEFGLEGEVPKVKPIRENEQDLPVVVIAQDGTSYLADKPVNINLIADEMRERCRNAQSVYLKGDRITPCDQVVQMIST